MRKEIRSENNNTDRGRALAASDTGNTEYRAVAVSDPKWHACRVLCCCAVQKEEVTHKLK